MASTLRTPPRFVPTLTTVVDDGSAEAAVQPASADPDPASPAPAAADDAGFVPPSDLRGHEETGPLAEVPPPAAPPSQIALTPADMALSEDEAFHIEEQLLHRVLQRIDLSLEQRLSDVVSRAVQERLDAMVPALRDEIEEVLRSLVIEALADELPRNTGSARGRNTDVLG